MLLYIPVSRADVKKEFKYRVYTIYYSENRETSLEKRREPQERAGMRKRGRKSMVAEWELSSYMYLSRSSIIAFGKQ